MPGHDARTASRELTPGALAPASWGEAAALHKLLLATKVAHEELGEKVALVIGSAVAARVGGLSSEWASKVLALGLLEVVSDLSKARAYAASKIDVGHTQFNFHFPTMLGVGLVGASSWCAMLFSISFNCLVGEDVASVFG